MKTCQEEKLIGSLWVVLYEYLGEEYPEVLLHLRGSLKAIVILDRDDQDDPADQGPTQADPHPEEQTREGQEKSCIDLVGRIADRDLSTFLRESG